MLNSKPYWLVGSVIVIASGVLCLRNWDDFVATRAGRTAFGYSQQNLRDAIAMIDGHDKYLQYSIDMKRKNDMLYVSSLLRYSLYRKAAATNEAIIEFARLKYILIQGAQLRNLPVSEIARESDELSGDVMYYYSGRRLIISDTEQFILRRTANDQRKAPHERRHWITIRGDMGPVASNIYNLACSGPTNCIALVTALCPFKSTNTVVKSVRRLDGKEMNYDVTVHESDDQSNGNLKIDFTDMDGVSRVYTVVTDKLVAGPGVRAEPK